MNTKVRSILSAFLVSFTLFVGCKGELENQEPAESVYETVGVEIGSSTSQVELALGSPSRIIRPNDLHILVPEDGQAGLLPCDEMWIYDYESKRFQVWIDNGQVSLIRWD